MKTLIHKEYKKREKEKELNIIALEKNLTKIDNNIENLLNTLTHSTSSVVQKRIEQKIEDLEIEKQKTSELIKQQEKAKDLEKHLEVCIDILQHTGEIREK